MAKKADKLGKEMYQRTSKLDTRHGNYYSDNSVLITDITDINKHFHFGNLYRSAAPSIIYVSKGHATHHLNMLKYELSEGDLILTPANCLISVIQTSDNFDPKIISFDIANSGIAGQDVLQMQLSPRHRKLMDEYFSLARSTMETVKHCDRALAQIFVSMLEVTMEINAATTNKKHKQHLSNTALIKRDFLRLLNSEGGTRHDVAFYAERIGITPNYLSIAIKKETDMTVQQWCRHRTVNDAKLFLETTNMSLAKIAKELGFTNAAQFGTFFKKETGMTPAEYRKSVVN